MKSVVTYCFWGDVMDSKGHYTVFRDFYDNSHSLVTWLQYEQYGINGSLLKRETNRPGRQPETELYRFGADGNLRMYSYDRLFYSLYGYDGGTTRTYKYSFDLTPNWVNGRLENVSFFCPFFCLETKETKVQ